MSAKRKFPVETAYINTFVQDGYGLSWTVPAGAQMRECGVDLMDVSHALENGHVFASDMVDQTGLWSVAGRTIENVGLNVTVNVVSAEYRVRITYVEKA